jgi:hypothetical protein
MRTVPEVSINVRKPSCKISVLKDFKQNLNMSFILVKHATKEFDGNLSHGVGQSV